MLEFQTISDVTSLLKENFSKFSYSTIFSNTPPKLRLASLFICSAITLDASQHLKDFDNTKFNSERLLIAPFRIPTDGFLKKHIPDYINWENTYPLKLNKEYLYKYYLLILDFDSILLTEEKENMFLKSQLTLPIVLPNTYCDPDFFNLNWFLIKTRYEHFAKYIFTHLFLLV